MTEELLNTALCIVLLLKIPVKEGWVEPNSSMHLRTVLIGNGILYCLTNSGYNLFGDCCVPNAVQCILNIYLVV